MHFLPAPLDLLLAVFILAAAFLYASVGQAGASGYLAVMAIFGLAPEVMRPTALTLNIIVAAVAASKFARAGYFNGSVFWPFAVTSIPFAFLGGMIDLPELVYKPVVGVVLLYAAFLMFRASRGSDGAVINAPPLGWALISGAGIGLLSGLTGVGGGIFLSPLLLFMGWAETRQTAATSAAFILVNSIAGLLGHASSIANLPGAIPVWAAAALAGGFIGAEYGSRHFGSLTLKRILVVILLVAGVKMLLP